MSNPANAVGTNAAYGGRTSVNAFNDDLAVYSRGIMSGWDCAPSSGLTVALGGNGNTRDVAVAEDNAGNKTTINNISGSPVSVTMSAAPGANSRIDAIVAYVDNPPQGSSTIADNYEACGLIAVSGTAATNPVAPNDSAIRSAITADGASGTTAYYVILAYITIESGTTDITSDMITAGAAAMVSTKNIDASLVKIFDGAASTVNQDYSLTDSLTNYRILIVKASPQDFQRISTTIPVAGITYGTGESDSYSIGLYETTQTYVSIKFSFKDANTFRILAKNFNTWTNVNIREIWGVK